jgi:hypothetical protein
MMMRMMIPHYITYRKDDLNQPECVVMVVVFSSNQPNHHCHVSNFSIFVILIGSSKSVFLFLAICTPVSGYFLIGQPEVRYIKWMLDPNWTESVGQGK